MSNTRLVAPRVRVIRSGVDEPMVVQTDNRDLVAYERTRLRHKWPKFDESPFQWLTFISWSGARRAGALDPSVTYEKWESEVLSVGDISDEMEDEIGRPTDAGPAPA